MFPRYSAVKERVKDGRSRTQEKWDLLVLSSSTVFVFFPVLLSLEQVDYMMPVVKYQTD